MRVVVEADGGARGNPGPAGYGAVVRDAATGAVLAERKAVGASEVDVRMDSKLVVEQMTGRWQVRHPPLQTLASRALELAGDFGTVTFEWIPRASNTHADRL